MKKFIQLSLLVGFCQLSHDSYSQEKEKYRHIFKLVESNIWQNSFYTFEDVDDKGVYVLASDKDKSFTTRLTPAFTIITPKRNLIEFEPSVSFSGAKGLIFDKKNNKVIREKTATGVSDYYKIPDNLVTQNTIKDRVFDFSIRTSYNFNILPKSSKNYLTLGPLLIWQYRYAKNHLVEWKRLGFSMEQRNLLNLWVGTTIKFGMDIGKRGYFDLTLPQRLYYLSYGKEDYDGVFGGTYRNKFVHYDYIEDWFLKSNYYRRFELNFSIGYKF